MSDTAAEQMPPSQMPPGLILATYRDGEMHGWPTEFAYLISEHGAEVAALIEDVEERGIREPILLGEDGRVWDGHHRLLVAQVLGLRTVPVKWSDQ